MSSVRHGIADWRCGGRPAAVLVTLLLLVGGADPSVAGRLPRYGGSLRVALNDVPASLDPLAMGGDEAALVASCMYEGLVRWNGVNAAPGLASQWVHDEGGSHWRFVLRNDVVFHDGTRCDAAAVRQSLQRLADPHQSSQAWLLANLVGWSDYAAGRTQEIAGIETPELDAIELRFDVPVPDLPARLALPVAAIAKRRGNGWIGTGPFQVQSTAPGELRLGLFKDHHDGRPYVERVVFVSRSRGEKALAGDVAELERALVGAPLPTGAARWRTPASRLGFALVHPKSAELASEDTRHRLAEAFDRSVFVRAVLGGDGEETERLSPRGPKTVASRSSESPADLASRPQQRARILVPASEPVLRALGERLQVHLFALGLGADLDVLGENQFEQALRLGRYDVVVLGWTPPQPRVGSLEPSTRVRLFVTSILAPILRGALPDAWAPARLASAKDPEQALLRGDLCIPLVFFHDLWQTTSDLQHVELGAAAPALGVASAHLDPHQP